MNETFNLKLAQSSKDDIDEHNRILMLLLGLWTPTPDETADVLRERHSELRHWTLHRTSGAPIERFSSYYWTPLNFYVDEFANALLLDKMRDMDTGQSDRALIDLFNELRRTNVDRKRAVCEAALKLLEAE